MKKLNHIILIPLTCFIIVFPFLLRGSGRMEETVSIERIKLPKANYDGPISVEKALFKRRSIRRYKNESLNLDEVSQLLWAAQGITDERGFRTAPSAGALYPLVVYLAVGNVEDLTPGLYKYKPHAHELIKVKEGDIISEIFNAALGQTCVKNGSIDIVFSAVYQRTTQKYGERGERYVHMEVGHAAQNVYLQATVLDLGTVVVGAFYDDRLKNILNMPDEEAPLYIMPVGRK